MLNENLDQIKSEENFIRDNLYKNEYKDHPMNTDPYFNLIEITEDIWNSICMSILQIKDNSELYFPESRLLLRKRISRSWNDIEKLAKDNKIEKYFGKNSDHVFIAGGKALATLLTVSATDVDYFTTKEIKPWEIESKYGDISVSQHLIGFSNKKQLIKRLYKTPHEIIHSFDIDCCSVLINKNGKIYATKRFIYSLVNGYNTVDFNYLSPSYEWRLIKYSNRGFSVHVPHVINCKDQDSLYQQNEYGICFPDSIWAYGDIDDILRGPTLKALLINALGLQKILISSAVSNPSYNENYTHSGQLVTSLATKQLSDYEVISNANNPVRGKLEINDNLALNIQGKIGDNFYRGTIVAQEDEENKIRKFSTNMHKTIMDILDSPYKAVKAGEQTTSTFHKIVLGDPQTWYDIDNSTLFENMLYTLLYFKRISEVPVFYDEKVAWFGPNCINLNVYHFARLFINNRIYDKFNGLEISTIKIASGDIRPNAITYQGEVFEISHRDSKGIIEVLLTIHEIYKIYTEKEVEMLISLNTRIEPDIVPAVEARTEE